MDTRIFAPDTRQPHLLATKLGSRDVNLFYGKFQALRNISLDVPDRAVTAIIGPSGCGKSSYLRLFNRMNDLIIDARVTGRVEVDGHNIYERDVDVVDVRRRVGMVFQRPNPFPMSIFENVAFGPRRHGKKNQAELAAIVEKSLRQAALWDEVKDRLDQPSTSLSGGQQQRLCIARSLALEPEVLLLDEPTSGLDPISTGKVEESLLELKKDYTIIIVPHSVQQAARVADHAAFFLLGDLVEHQEGRDLFTSPRDKRTEDYITGRFG